MLDMLEKKDIYHTKKLTVSEFFERLDNESLLLNKYIAALFNESFDESHLIQGIQELNQNSLTVSVCCLPDQSFFYELEIDDNRQNDRYIIDTLFFLTNIDRTYFDNKTINVIIHYQKNVLKTYKPLARYKK